MYRRVARDFNADVEALRDRNREVAAGDRRDGETIDGGQLAIELIEKLQGCFRYLNYMDARNIFAYSGGFTDWIQALFAAV